MIELFVCKVTVFGYLYVVFFFFLMVAVLGILVISAFLLLPVLLPVAATDNSLRAANISVGTFNDLDKLSIGHVGVRVSASISQ